MDTVDDYDDDVEEGTVQEISEIGGVALPPQPAPAPPRLQITPAEMKRFICIYPAYMDVSLSVSEGRRLPKCKLQGCEAVDLGDLVNSFGVLANTNRWPSVRALWEPAKRLPRGDQPGRLRVEMASIPAGGPKSRDELMTWMAPIIPELETRKKRLVEIEKYRLAVEEMRKKQGPKKQNKKQKEKSKVRG